MGLKSVALALLLALGAIGANADASLNPWGKVGSFGVLGFTGATNNGFGGALISGSGSVLLAYTPMENLGVGAGLILNRDLGGNWTSGIQAAVTYQIFDRYPFSAGPEFLFTGFFRPGSFFATTVYEPAWGFWYAPFKDVNLAVGSAILTTFMISGGSWSFNLNTPTLRMFYIFS